MDTTTRGPRPGTDRAVAGALLVLALASLLLTSWIPFRSWGALLDALGRTATDPLSPQGWQALWTGLVSSHLLVLQVVVLARLPWLERAWGRDVLTRLHRRLATWSIGLMVAHVLLFVLQRVARAPQAVGPAMLDLFVTEQHMLVASLGTVLLLLVTVTSVARARRWLRYETWHLLHLWAYVGMGLALPHQLVSVDFGSTWVRAYWWTLYLATLGAVLVFRVALPLVRSWRHDLRVVEVVPETSGVVSVEIGGRRLDRLGLRSGQFGVWRFLGGPGWTRGHPYSLSRAPRPDGLRVSVGGDGDGARRLARVRPGARVLLEGPYGALAPLRRRHPHLVLLAAGVGVTPFRALLEDTPLGAGGATLVHRVRSEADLLFGDELEELAARRGVRLVRWVGPRRSAYSMLPVGVEGDAGERLLEQVPQLLDSDVLVCGPPDWAATVRRVALGVGVHPRDLRQEDFGW